MEHRHNDSRRTALVEFFAGAITIGLCIAAIALVASFLGPF